LILDPKFAVEIAGPALVAKTTIQVEKKLDGRSSQGASDAEPGTNQGARGFSIGPFVFLLWLIASIAAVLLLAVIALAVFLPMRLRKLHHVRWNRRHVYARKGDRLLHVPRDLLEFYMQIDSAAIEEKTGPEPAGEAIRSWRFVFGLM